MKTLYLVRHAEASEQNASTQDYDRPLTKHGEENIFQLGQRFSRWPHPELIISSPAMRAKTTASILMTGIDFPASSIVFDEGIYEAELGKLLSVICGADNTVARLMLVGHNPALTQLVHALGVSAITHMPTCSMAILRFPSDTWNDLSQIRAELVEFDYPNMEAT